MDVDKHINKLELYLVDNPDDLDSWAVLGDLWLEKGHPRGEIIALTSRYERSNNEFYRERLNTDIKYLERMHESILCPSLFSLNDNIIMKYGYVFSLSLDFSDVMQLQSDGGGKNIYDTCKMLQSLHVSYKSCNWVSLLEIFNCFKCYNINFFSLMSYGEDPYENDNINAELMLLAENNKLYNLKSLYMPINSIHDSGLVALINFCPNLTKIMLFDNKITNNGALYIAISEKSKRLELLDLGQNNLDNQAINALLDSENLKSCEIGI